MLLPKTVFHLKGYTTVPESDGAIFSEQENIIDKAYELHVLIPIAYISYGGYEEHGHQGIGQILPSPQAKCILCMTRRDQGKGYVQLYVFSPIWIALSQPICWILTSMLIE